MKQSQSKKSLDLKDKQVANLEQEIKEKQNIIMELTQRISQHMEKERVTDQRLNETERKFDHLEQSNKGKDMIIQQLNT